ncbi:hypothetical protein JL107_08285 [Nakamurella flavida]|uniref:Uncharacterized protein n=1 Tax=Nakamurella flavida TaxID=363630 RepID=A0A938YEY5_9ACTN|nr:hypothetical protein [Nakamurella flavida]MBM9476435.1 hypothetical protein [Nakamurella flavida]MDP9779464.1 hypothetical protein [Nakamurella flavida]
MTTEIDGSYTARVERTSFGDIAVHLPGQDLTIVLDAADAARISRDILDALGRRDDAAA